MFNEMLNKTLLNYREFGNQNENLLILHGLFGSAMSWQAMGKHLSSHFHTLIPDLRNHGRSFHSESMDYPTQADDILHLMDSLEIERIHLLGHSMGGKIATTFALLYPHRVERLMLIDIAPRLYHHDYGDIFRAMRVVFERAPKRRQEAESLLIDAGISAGLSQFLLTNWVLQQGEWCWRLNVPVLEREIATLLNFPKLDYPPFPGESLVLYGTDSDYLQPNDHEVIKELLPNNRIVGLQGGHWLHVDNPDGVYDEILGHFHP